MALNKTASPEDHDPTSPAERWILRLYVAGMTPTTQSTLANLEKLCTEHLEGRYTLEVLDLIEQPLVAEADQILATPTLIRKRPLPVRRIIGDLSNIERVLIGIGAPFLEITERRRREQTQRRLATVMRDSNDAITVLDLEGTILEWNRGAERIYGYPARQAVGQSILTIIPAARQAETQAFLLNLARGMKVASFETQRLTRDGRILDVWLTATALQDTTGNLTAVATTERDITERKRTVQELSRLSQVFMNAVDPIFITDFQGTILNVNRQVQQTFGWTREQLLGQSVSTLLPPAQRASIDDLFRHCQRGGNVDNITGTWWNQAGQPCPVRLTLFPLPDEAEGTAAIALIVRDIREQEQLEAILRQAQKMEAVGQLTGGIAHDFNNLLTIVLGNLQLLEAPLKDQPKLDKYVQTARQAALRGAELIRQLLAYSRRQALEPQPIDLNQRLADMLALLHRTLGETIEIEIVPGQDLWQAQADPHQLETALLNLALNARDAMPHGGQLIIETANVSLDAAYVNREVDLKAGDYVMLAVSDSGSGMAPEVIEQAFEPFFTTKAAGRGSGLGLSMVYGFAKQSAGHVKLYSELGQGTTVKLYLPRAEESVEPAPEHRLSTLSLAGGHETVLVVEDDEGVLELTSSFLSSLGYTVLQAMNGPAALDRLEQDPAIDLLFTDIVMPCGMSGVELASEARRRCPNLKVLYTSGYTENTIIHQGRLNEGVVLLNKPYQLETLAAKVRSALDGQPD